MNALSVICIVGLINLTTFMVFWWDKQAAREGSWRVRESTLLSLALIGGSVGAVLAQQMLRHKTRKQPFRSMLIIVIGFQISLICSGLILAQ